MAERNILNDLFRRVVRNRRGQTSGLSTNGDLVKLCKDLLTDRGEISGLYRAQGILDRLDRSTDAEKTAFLLCVPRELGMDEDALTAAIAKWSPGDVDAARDIHFAAEPRGQELIRALNRVSGATARLVGLRACLLSMLRDTPTLRGLDRIFFTCFRRGSTAAFCISTGSTGLPPPISSKRSSHTRPCMKLPAGTIYANAWATRTGDRSPSFTRPCRQNR